MVQPRLIQPVWITITPRDTTATSYDPDSREPIGQVTRYKAAIRIKAQVHYPDRNSPDYRADEAESRINLMFRYKDLGKLGYEPARGDKVTAIGRTTASLYMNRFEPCGHYPDKDGATLLLVYLVENEGMR